MMPSALAVAVAARSPRSSRSPAACEAGRRRPRRRRPTPQRRRRRPMQEATPRRSARELHADLAAGYYERGQMDVALEELQEARCSSIRTIREIYNVYGLVYTMLGEDAEGGGELPARARSSRPNDSGDPPQLGLVPVQHGKRARVDPRVRAGGAQPAVQDARDRAHQRRQVLRSRSATASGAERILPARADGRRRAMPTAATTSRCSPTRRRAIDEARALMRRGACGSSRAPEALYSACASSASSATAARRLSFASQLRNRYPDSPRRGSRSRELRVTRTSDHERAGPRHAPRATPAAGDVTPRARRHVAARGARGGRACRVDAVAQQLKLAPRQVRALEADDFAQLPGRTFVRGFVRNYARLLNLDADAVLAALPDRRSDVAARASRRYAPSTRAMGELPPESPRAAAVRALGDSARAADRRRRRGVYEFCARRRRGQSHRRHMPPPRRGADASARRHAAADRRRAERDAAPWSPQPAPTPQHRHRHDAGIGDDAATWHVPTATTAAAHERDLAPTRRQRRRARGSRRPPSRACCSAAVATTRRSRRRARSGHRSTLVVVHAARRGSRSRTQRRRAPVAVGHRGRHVAGRRPAAVRRRPRQCRQRARAFRGQPVDLTPHTRFNVARFVLQ